MEAEYIQLYIELNRIRAVKTRLQQISTRNVSNANWKPFSVLGTPKNTVWTLNSYSFSPLSSYSKNILLYKLPKSTRA